MKQKNQNAKHFVVFRKWDNKGFAVFRSLKQVIKISTLSVAYLLFANHNEANAQEADSMAVSRSIDIEEIDVTGEQHSESYSNLSRVVVTISKKEIERSSVSSVNELLEYASNIDIRQRGVHGVQADISIRGGSADQVLVLLNGFNISDPQTGHHHLNIPIDLSSIQRIEILKGPGAWKFGPGAFSGAINIITSQPENSSVRIIAEYGSFNFNQEKIAAALVAGKMSHSLYAGNLSTDGYTSNTDFSKQHVFYKGNYTTEHHEVSLQAGLTDKAFGANSFYTAMFPDQFEEIQNYLLTLGSKSNFKNVRIEPRLMFRRNNDKFLLFRDYPSRYANFHTSEVLNGNILTTFFHKGKATTSLGLDVRNENIFSNNLGETAENPRTSPVADSITLDRFHSRTNFSMFAGYKWYWDKLMLNVGANLSYNTDLENKLFVFPGLDLNYALSNTSSLFASVNKTMRMPTYTELYYQGPNNEGNLDLLPEEAIGYELGYRFKNKYHTFSLTGFVRNGENMIDWVKESLDDKWRTVNFSELTSGVELAWKTNFDVILENQEILKDFSIAYTYLDQEKLEHEYISNYSLNYLKHRLDVSLHAELLKHVHLNWHLAWQDRNGRYEEIVNQESKGLKEYAPFLTNDLKLSWEKNSLKLYLSANNVFNVDYYDIGNVPQPGRWMKVGVSYHFDFP